MFNEGDRNKLTILNIYKILSLIPSLHLSFQLLVELVRNLMAQAQKPHFVFCLHGRVHLNRRGASVQSTAGSRGVRISVSNAGYTTFQGCVRVLATHSIRQFPLHFPSCASPCATTFRTQYTSLCNISFFVCEHAIFSMHSVLHTCCKVVQDVDSS